MKCVLSALTKGFIAGGLLLSQANAQSFVSSASPIDSNGLGALPNPHDWVLQSTIQIDAVNGKLGWSGQLTGQKVTQTQTQTRLISVVQPFPLLPKLTLHTLELTYTTRGDSVNVNYNTGMKVPIFDSNLNAWTIPQPHAHIEIPASMSYNLYQEGSLVASGSFDYTLTFSSDPIRAIDTANFPSTATPILTTFTSLVPTSQAALGNVTAPSGAIISIPPGGIAFLPEPWEYGLATTSCLMVFAFLRRRSAFLRPPPQSHAE